MWRILDANYNMQFDASKNVQLWLGENVRMSLISTHLLASKFPATMAK